MGVGQVDSHCRGRWLHHVEPTDVERLDDGIADLLRVSLAVVDALRKIMEEHRDDDVVRRRARGEHTLELEPEVGATEWPPTGHEELGAQATELASQGVERPEVDVDVVLDDDLGHDFSLWLGDLFGRGAHETISCSLRLNKLALQQIDP